MLTTTSASHHSLSAAARVAILAALALCTRAPCLAQSDGDTLFETRVRPMLVERCAPCHGSDRQSAGVRLDTRDSAFKDRLIVPGDAVRSRVLQAVRYDGAVRMPPTGRLADADIAALTRWVKIGAPWPTVSPPASGASPGLPHAERRSFWSFQPVRRPALPPVADARWCRTPVDRFILAGLERRGMRPAPPADRRTLIRRATMDLTGLPPTPAEVDAFLKDRSPDAFARVVDRLLASARYGERWGRHWLDVVRYADSLDSRGLGSEGDISEAWRYRDWVVNALNSDMPYDRFVMNQVAGDLVPGANPGEMNIPGTIATGMLAIGNWGNGDADKEKILTDIADDQVDVVSRGFMGLTMACARCHDHKFDPISTKDYYALAGIFFSSHILPKLTPKGQGETPLRIPLMTHGQARQRAQFAARLSAAQAADDSARTAAYRRFAAARMSQTAAYALAVWESAHRDSRAAHSSMDLLASARGLDLWAFHAWSSFLGYSKPAEGPAITPPQGYVHAIAYWRSAMDHASSETERRWACDELQRCINISDSRSPFWIRSSAAERALPASDQAGISAADAAVTAVQKQAPPPPQYANGAQEGGVPESSQAGIHDVRVHIRGSYQRLGDMAPRGFPVLLAGTHQPPIRSGSGRLELARWIASSSNPLTPRVIVNRLWQHHFGEGIVRTASNFGWLGDRPANQELLDWLAAAFVDRHGCDWSLKRLHRLIMLSAAYRQSDTPSALALRLDPDNRLISHMSRQRLEAEAIRDSLLAASGSLDTTMGGKGVQDYAAPRRSLYVMTIRSDRSGFGPLFDVADSTASVERRVSSIVAPQALYLLDSPFVIAQCRKMAERILAMPTTVRGAAAGQAPPDATADRERIRWAYSLLFSRPPSDQEIGIGLRYLAAARRQPTLDTAADEGGDVKAWASYCQVLVCTNEFIFVD